MGRGRGKGKKQNFIAARDDNGSGEDEKLPSRRRGRPQKPLKDEIEDKEEVEKIEPEEDEEGEGKDTKSYIMNGNTENEDASENGRKRKRSSLVKENANNGMGTKTNNDDSIKFVGYRQNGSRRKNKPRRAAEVGVECK